MTPRFTWSAAARAKVVPGCTVEVSSPMLSGRYTVVEATPSWVSLDDGGYTASVTWSYVDPESVVAPKQMVMF